MQESQNSSGNSMGRMIGIAVLVGGLMVGIVVYALVTNKKPEANTAATPTPIKATASSSSSATAAGYKDGSYSATGSYQSPGGIHTVAVSLTLKSGVITDVTATPQASDADSKEYQSMFVSGYKAQVVGKQIDDLKLDRVSGSSLTSGGFNDALSQIKAQAKA